jgi:hypothetical protein
MAVQLVLSCFAYLFGVADFMWRRVQVVVGNTAARNEKMAGPAGFLLVNPGRNSPMVSTRGRTAEFLPWYLRQTVLGADRPVPSPLIHSGP